LPFSLRKVAVQLLLLSAVCAPSLASDSPMPWETQHFAIDPKLLYAEASDPIPAQGTDTTVLDEENTFTFDSEGRSIHTEYLVYKVWTQRGAEGGSRVSVGWAPWHQEKPKINIRVITPDFVVHPLDPATLSDASAQDEEANLYSDRRVLRGPLPAIAPGSVVEREVVINESVPMFGAGIVDRYFLGRVLTPVRHVELVLKSPRSVPLQYAVQLLPDLKPEITEANGLKQIVFERNHVSPLQDAETNLPSDVPAYPSVSFSTGASWKAVADGYTSVVESHVSSSQVKPLAEKLTQKLKTRDDKIQALLSYLDKEIRYTGVEFGEAAIVPHSPDESLTRKYGDCKDKSTLLVAMLRAAGIPAYVTLLNAGARLDVPSELPGLGLFDHAIVYVPGSPDLWIDATDEYARLGQLPIRDQGRQALIARPGTTALIRTPEEPFQGNTLVEFREIHLAEYGPARIVERTQPHGSTESSYRRSYSDTQNKNTKDGLTNYVKSQYLAESLDRFERSDPDDLSHQFELVLESNRAKRGFTDLEIAVAAIRAEGLFYRLPYDLRQRDTSDSTAPKTKRIADYQLPEAFVTEWRYTIEPPPGYRARPLPQNTDIHIGPCLLHEEFTSDTNNRVYATLRFDSGKRRLTAAESDEVRDRIVQITEGPALAIYFESIAQALANEGKIREALNADRDLIALHPKEAVHHLQIANILLGAGLGEAARTEAGLAVKLEPNSELAQKTLGEVLEHDLIGRKLRHGSDYARAEVAFRQAEKLDADDKQNIGNLAILLEYNPWGLRYGPGAKLKDAVAEYRKLTSEERNNIGIQNNLPFALFYDGQFAEAERIAQELQSPPSSLIVACEAALNGSEAGLAEARKRTSGEQEFREVATAAGSMLANLRKYSLAADLVQVGASGTSASDLQAEAAELRKTRLREQIPLGDDVQGIVLKFILLEYDSDLTVDKLQSISSRNGAVELATSEVRDALAKNQSQILTEKALKGDFSDVGIDLAITRAQPNIQGNDATGYKITLWSSATYEYSVYVVKEEGHYKVLATSRYPTGIGLEVLDRVEANDLTAARTLLDWLREDEHLEGGDDPVAGKVFPRFWAKGRPAEAAKMKLAAAAILVRFKGTASRSLPILQQALTAASSDSEKANITLALAHCYDSLRDYKGELAESLELARQFPESPRAFRWADYSLRWLGKRDEADRLAQDRLKTIPDDLEARHAMIYNAIAVGDFDKAESLYKQLADEGKATAEDMNGMAWNAIFTGKPKDSDVEIALKAAQLSNNSWHILHTLGCLYANLGKLKEARELLVQAMDAADFDEPDSNFWYGFGRIAEQSGERTSALTDYGRVPEPKYAMEIPHSSYQLAQIRIKAMQKTP